MRGDIIEKNKENTVIYYHCFFNDKKEFLLKLVDLEILKVLSTLLNLEILKVLSKRSNSASKIYWQVVCYQAKIALKTGNDLALRCSGQQADSRFGMFSHIAHA